tara:strand:+ start:424 stop:1086 length:663 start_codon:yes stop_codon:yes gene_type:complete
MKYAIKIHKISTVDELENSWNIEDYKELLELFDFANDEVNDLKELRELLFMAISEREPNEAAAIVLDYKLGSQLNEGQIDSLSYEMLIDKISEEYPVIGLHKTLFAINQLLYKAFNGKFPNTKATVVNFEIKPSGNASEIITNEIALKCFAQNLDSHNVLKRLFGHQLDADEEFDEANDVVWNLEKNETTYTLTTSDYWMSKDEFLNEELECKITFFEKE